MARPIPLRLPAPVTIAVFPASLGMIGSPQASGRPGNAAHQRPAKLRPVHRIAVVPQGGDEDPAGAVFTGPENGFFAAGSTMGAAGQAVVWIVEGGGEHARPRQQPYAVVDF